MGNPGRFGLKSKARVLFFAEAVTLAHVARPYRLASGLDGDRFETVFACAKHFRPLFPRWPWPTEPLSSVPPATFVDRLARGARLYPLDTLRRYVEEDLRIIDAVRPDLIVGDFRLSLSVSARLKDIPYLSLSNAYWSPYVTDRHIPTPCLPLTRALPMPAASALFALSRPFAFAWHALPLNRLRREYGLSPLGFDLRRVYTDADYTLYADVPELVPTIGRPDRHRYLGAVTWSPDVPIPAELAGRAEIPLVYVTMGSSGSADVLPAILAALAELDCRVVLAAAGAQPPKVPANAIVTDYLPGERMAALARLVVCNGGSPTSHQALVHGVPVLGIPSNLDQHLNMHFVARLGAGLVVRPEEADPESIRAAAIALLQEPRHLACAARLAEAFAAIDTAAAFADALDSALQRGGKDSPRIEAE